MKVNAIDKTIYIQRALLGRVETRKFSSSVENI